MKINTILSTKGPDVVVIRPEQSLEEAMALLEQRNIGALVVLEADGQLAGIISERDVIRAAARHGAEIFAWQVSQVMTHKVITGMPQDDVIAVAHTMTERRIRHLPILVEDRLVGIVSIGDILKAQRDQYLGEIDTLHSQMLADSE
ncbi:MAG: CBS domain-containing protein [Candidatus Promineifilaceae bacterium]